MNLAAWISLILGIGLLRPRTRGQAGEGVISTGIAVLVMAGLGALMWAGFQDLWLDASIQTADQLSRLGR
ncbi:MAG: hypothetical protein ACT4OS_10605 [Acidimicrobiales bacterium]